MENPFNPLTAGSGIHPSPLFTQKIFRRPYLKLHGFSQLFINLTFDGMFFTHSIDGGGVDSIHLLRVKTIEKVHFLAFFCMVKYSEFS